MRAEVYNWPKSQALAEDYCRDHDNTRELFTYPPALETNWETRAKWLDESNHAKANRQELAQVLQLYNTQMGNSPEALANIERLRESNTLTVIGGQQTGLFTGPLLVIYKAITLIQTANHAALKLGRPVVPIFWLAGEDHDFDEVNHTYTLTQQLEIAKIKINAPHEIRSSISKLHITDWEEALQQLDLSLVQTEFKAELMDKLKEISGASHSLVHFFARTFAWLFRKQGLILMDSDDPNIRRLERAMFTEILQQHEHINAALLGGKQRVEAMGYKAQTELAAGNVNLFIFVENGERKLLQWDGQLFHDKKYELTYPKEQLLEWAMTAPERFSNNVMTRPLMQEYLFPVLATVLGPGEIAYWALTGDAFHMLGMQMPIVVPRMEITLIEGTVAKQMDKFALSVDTVVHQFEAWKKDWLSAHDELGLPALFAEVKAQFKALYDPLLHKISVINPGLQKLGDLNAQKINEQIEFLEARAVEANQSQYEAAIRQLERIRLSLLPLGKPQERVYNIIGYLNKYGDGLLGQLLELPYEANGEHRLIYI